MLFKKNSCENKISIFIAYSGSAKNNKRKLYSIVLSYLLEINSLKSKMLNVERYDVNKFRIAYIGLICNIV